METLNPSYFHCMEGGGGDSYNFFNQIIFLCIRKKKDLHIWNLELSLEFGTVPSIPNYIIYCIYIYIYILGVGKLTRYYHGNTLIN